MASLKNGEGIVVIFILGLLIVAVGKDFLVEAIRVEVIKKLR